MRLSDRPIGVRTTSRGARQFAPNTVWMDAESTAFTPTVRTNVDFPDMFDPVSSRFCPSKR